MSNGSLSNVPSGSLFVYLGPYPGDFASRVMFIVDVYVAPGPCVRGSGAMFVSVGPGVDRLSVCLCLHPVLSVRLCKCQK